MANFMRCLAVAAFGLALQLVPACGQDCGDGTVRQGDNCVPESFRCGAGTVLSDGVCIAVVDACGDGTHVDDQGQCTIDPGGGDFCAEGTQFDVSLGRCVTTVPSRCGPNTIAVDDTCVVAARLQVIHSDESPSADVVDVYVDDLLFVNDLAYRTATRFLTVPAGTHTIAVALADSGNLVGDEIPPEGTVSTTVAANPVTDTVAVLRGFDTGSFGVASRELPRVVDSGSVAFTLVHASPDGPPAADLEDEGANRDSEADDTTLVDDLAFGGASPVVTVDAGRTVFAVADGGGSDDRRYRVIWSDIGGSALTLVVSGYLDPEAGNAFALVAFSKDGGAGKPLPIFDGPR